MSQSFYSGCKQERLLSARWREQIPMHEIWDSIAAEPGRTHLTAAQERELERRLAEHEADPGDVVPWEEVKAQALTRFQQP